MSARDWRHYGYVVAALVVAFAVLLAIGVALLERRQVLADNRKKDAQIAQLIAQSETAEKKATTERQQLQDSVDSIGHKYTVLIEYLNSRGEVIPEDVLDGTRTIRIRSTDSDGSDDDDDDGGSSSGSSGGSAPSARPPAGGGGSGDGGQRQPPNSSEGAGTENRSAEGAEHSQHSRPTGPNVK